MIKIFQLHDYRKASVRVKSEVLPRVDVNPSVVCQKKSLCIQSIQVSLPNNQSMVYFHLVPQTSFGGFINILSKRQLVCTWAKH